MTDRPRKSSFTDEAMVNLLSTSDANLSANMTLLNVSPVDREDDYVASSNSRLKCRVGEGYFRAFRGGRLSQCFWGCLKSFILSAGRFRVFITDFEP
jgi:hypothetical protein